MSAAEYISLARCAERAERYDDMSKFMLSRAKLGNELSSEERDMLSHAFKLALSGRRQAVRLAMQMETTDNPFASNAAGYRSLVQNELRDLCQQVLDVLDKDLIPKAQPGESMVFFLKMAGDYYRYMAEAANQQTGDIPTNASLRYAAATEEAKRSLPSAHPVRLGLALNFSVFLHEVLGDAQSACRCAQEALQSAPPEELQSLPPDSQSDAFDTLTLLQQNLELWAQA
mmetsp:Transcript_55288/g.85983  ORF Transcript_55288/g.85983 Transcript_55288/m.85983 type:complete len:229 (+) Transcript_55288:70-756(+)